MGIFYCISLKIVDNTVYTRVPICVKKWGEVDFSRVQTLTLKGYVVDFLKIAEGRRCSP
ncbi:MAG: hypothetical protein ACE5KK_00150 [Candidatus Brocadiales bacterium]